MWAPTSLISASALLLVLRHFCYVGRHVLINVLALLLVLQHFCYMGRHVLINALALLLVIRHFCYMGRHVLISASALLLYAMTLQYCTVPVVTPEPNLTWLANSNQNPGDALLILLFYILLSFIFQKCRDPNPRLDPKGRSEPEPGLLRCFHLSYQNIYLCHFVLRFSITRKHFQMGGP